MQYDFLFFVFLLFISKFQNEKKIILKLETYALKIDIFLMCLNKLVPPQLIFQRISNFLLYQVKLLMTKNFFIISDKIHIHFFKAFLLQQNPLGDVYITLSSF